MSVTQFELDGFHHFASEKLAAAGAEFTWGELFALWDSTRRHDPMHDAIGRGLANVAAGHYRPADEVMDEIREEFGFPK